MEKTICRLPIQNSLRSGSLSDLQRFSYSKLSTFTQCPMKYDLKYNQGNYDQPDAIHLDLGNILHKVLEIKYRGIIEKQEVPVEELIRISKEGVQEETEKDKGKCIIGISEIMEKFGFEKFVEVNEKSNLSYTDKLDTFYNYLANDKLNDEWKPFAVEQHFDFEYEGKAILNGFIDRIDINQKGELRVVDYKSSNKVFDDKELTTPLQMVIYAFACERLFGKIPVEFQYDMILLGQKQLACSKGYYNRGVKKLNKILDEIKEFESKNKWKPKPTPLCHWCEFSNTNPNATFYLQDLCEYYCLWTPDKKTFEKNKEYKEDEFDFDF